MKACILYAFEYGEYGHRIELCLKQNQIDVENSPTVKEVLSNPDPQVGLEQMPFGPWVLPPNRRRKRNQPRGQPKNQGPQDSKYPKGEGRAVAKPRKAVWVRKPEARCVRTGEKSVVFQPSGKKTLSASRSTISDTVPFYRFTALRHVAKEDSRTHARSLGRYFFLKI